MMKIIKNVQWSQTPVQSFSTQNSAIIIGIKKEEKNLPIKIHKSYTNIQLNNVNRL